MSYKKHLIFLIILFGIIFSLALLFTSSTQNLNILLGIPWFKQPTIPTETNLDSAINNLIKNMDRRYFDINEKNTCYWIRSTLQKGKYLLEINEYENTDEMAGCTGEIKETRYIELKHNINLRGIDCLCGINKYTLEWESSGLKITKG